MRRSRRWSRRRATLVVGAAVLVVWMVAELVAGGGVWWTVGAYLANLTARAGPTRDLGRRLSDLAGRSAARPIVLRVWDWWSPSTTEAYAAYFGELEEIFESRHPQVDVVFQAVPFSHYEQKLAVAMLGDRPPDVFQCSVYWAQGLYQRGVLRELNNYVRDAPELDDDKFIPAALYHSRLDGHIYGVPHIVDARCLLWNLDMLAADPALHDMFERGPNGRPDFRRIRFDAVRDWDHFRQVVRRLTKRPRKDRAPEQAGFEINAYGMEAASFMPWAAANGVRFQDRRGTRALFGTPASAEALRFLLELYWTDRVAPPFRRALASRERFQKRTVACAMGGTWDGKYIVRDTHGWTGFGMTAFPPGPRGRDHKTQTWGNMMVISSRCEAPEAAWAYLRLVCSLEGSLLRLKHLKQNSPRLDFYGRDEWKAAVRDWPFLANVRRICASGDPLHHTQTQAVRDEVQPIFEYMMLNWPDVKAGRGRYAGPAEALRAAADRVNAVYRRYHRAVAAWQSERRRRGGQEVD